jgi:hypothetical protein
MTPLLTDSPQASKLIRPKNWVEFSLGDSTHQLLTARTIHFPL